MLHNDKHVVKMNIEYPQLMSTAHRVLDGEEYYDKTKNNRRIKRWRLDVRSIWRTHSTKHLISITRQTSGCDPPHLTYLWMYGLWESLAEEYTHDMARFMVRGKNYTKNSKCHTKKHS